MGLIVICFLIINIRVTKVCLQNLKMQIVSSECGSRTAPGDLYNIRYRYNLRFYGLRIREEENQTFDTLF